MSDRIGIDTHGLDQPPDDEWDDDDDVDEEEEREGEIVGEIEELVEEYTELAGHSPRIAGYTTVRLLRPTTGLRTCPYCKGSSQDTEQTEVGIRVRCSCGSCGPLRQNSMLARLAWNAD